MNITRSPRIAAMARHLDEAARRRVDAREAEEAASDAPMGSAEHSGLLTAARGLRQVASHAVSEAGRIASRAGR